MALIPDVVKTTAAAILEGYELANKESPHRMHLGGSVIGNECDRAIWYTFRWADHEVLPGQKLRLFQTGHLQEPRVHADLRRIGIDVHDATPDGAQWKVATLGGHFGGSLDGAVLGVIEAPKTWHLLEVKTANQKNFTAMQSKGLKKSKPAHYEQTMTYMGLAKLTRALYVMVNKNTDEIYTERVRFDQAEFDRIIAKAKRIITATEPPEKCSQDPTWYACGYCKFNAICWGPKAPESNCRTCAHSTPDITGDAALGEGKWICSNEKLASNPVLSEALQRTGCQEHRIIPILLKNTCEPVDYRNGRVVYRTKDGTTFENGDGTDGSFTSQEIRNAGSPALLPEMVPLKLQYKTARVVS